MYLLLVLTALIVSSVPAYTQTLNGRGIGPVLHEYRVQNTKSKGKDSGGQVTLFSMNQEPTPLQRRARDPRPSSDNYAGLSQQGRTVNVRWQVESIASKFYKDYTKRKPDVNLSREASIAFHNNIMDIMALCEEFNLPPEEVPHMIGILYGTYQKAQKDGHFRPWFYADDPNPYDPHSLTPLPLPAPKGALSRLLPNAHQKGIEADWMAHDVANGGTELSVYDLAKHDVAVNIRDIYENMSAVVGNSHWKVLGSEMYREYNRFMASHPYPEG